ncbi:hypothetical protein COCNU_12G003140 [Cocos nucifera]|uniref:Uncharacterized protein n=1 Tax=Cocos nucifera TaxID=13894 RepID=A0A8K0N9U9_COCNU|nr:hypothetical protein COCNU_12G003140 [Cocos nucifera]
MRDPPLDQCLAQDLKILHGFEVSELKELLSEQSLFNMGISPISFKGADPNLSQLSGSKIFQKRRMEAADGKSTQARVGLLLAPSIFRSEDLEPPTIEGFEIVQISHGSDLSILEGGRGSPIECSFSEAILSLPALDVANPFSEEEPIEVVGILVATLDKAKSVELIHYLNGFMEYTFEQFFKATRYKTEAKMLKVTKDGASEGVEEAFARTEAAEKRAQDVETALVKSAKENSHLLGVNETLTSKIEVLKTWLIEAEVFKEGAWAVLKDIEERMASLQDDMRVHIEIATVKTVEKFRTLKEYKDEQDRFAIDAYDEVRCSIRREVASYYPRLNLDFLDEDLEATDIDMAGVQSDRKDVH